MAVPQPDEGLLEVGELLGRIAGLAQLVAARVAEGRDAVAHAGIGVVAQPIRGLHDVRVGIVDHEPRRVVRHDRKSAIGMSGPPGGRGIGAFGPIPFLRELSAAGDVVVSMSNTTRRLALVAATVVAIAGLAACKNADASEASKTVPSVAEAPAAPTTEVAPTTAAVPTTEAPATTVAPTTTAAPATTVPAPVPVPPVPAPAPPTTVAATHGDQGGRRRHRRGVDRSEDPSDRHRHPRGRPVRLRPGGPAAPVARRGQGRDAHAGSPR